MNVIVNDQGFYKSQRIKGVIAWDEMPQDTGVSGSVIDMPNTVGPEKLQPYFDAAMIRIAFPNSADGRGFSLARHLRLLGYEGHLRAHGHILADQYAMARRVGFNDVEISNELALRQPEEQWLFRANWQEHCYLNRIKKAG